MRKIVKKEGGFNLIELLVVMAIIAVLIALVVAAISIARRATRNTERRNTAQTIKAGLEDYYARNKQYPATARSGAATLTNLSNDLNLGTTLTDPNDQQTRYCYKRGFETGTEPGKYTLRVRMETAGAVASPVCNAADTLSEDFSNR